MPRLLFEKTGKAVWISHLDLMRVFQRAFKRAGLSLTHTQGFNPRPSVSIALPLSVGVQSHCELLDFDLDGDAVPCGDILARLNQRLIEGVRVLSVYDNGAKIKNLAFLDCRVELIYDSGVPKDARNAIADLFSQASLLVEKKGKNGIVEQDIIPMIRSLKVSKFNDSVLSLDARICCLNPTLNPAQLCAAIERYLPAYQPDFCRYTRLEIYDQNESVFR